jgi:hypothetical protein
MDYVGQGQGQSLDKGTEDAESAAQRRCGIDFNDERRWCHGAA